VSRICAGSVSTSRRHTVVVNEAMPPAIRHIAEPRHTDGENPRITGKTFKSFLSNALRDIESERIHPDALVESHTHLDLVASATLHVVGNRPLSCERSESVKA
jgi:hypothetical protein